MGSVPGLKIDEFLSRAQDCPVLDVRSPGEFEKGHIPGAFNMPLFSNEERALVGITYKEAGQATAIEKGLEIVGPKMADMVRQARTLAPDGNVLIHCWRGGMRSGSVAWLLGFSGFKVATLQGGYKAFRRKVLASFETQTKLLVLGGMTGSGKTEILHELAGLGEQVINLEGLAHHKGSSYGAINQAPQPSTEQFENTLFTHWQTLDFNRRIWIEDESRTIGSVYLPQPLWRQMQQAPVVEIQIPAPVRVQRLIKDYGLGEADLLVAATERIRKRLGPQNTDAALDAIRSGDYAHASEIILQYYDKSYGFLLERRRQQTRVFPLPTDSGDARTNAERLIAFIEETGEIADAASASPAAV